MCVYLLRCKVSKLLKVTGDRETSEFVAFADRGGKMRRGKGRAIKALNGDCFPVPTTTCSFICGFFPRNKKGGFAYLLRIGVKRINRGGRKSTYI